MNCSARRPCFMDHLFLASDSRQVPRLEIFSNFFPFLVHRCFGCRNFHSLRHRNKFVNQFVMLWWILTFSCNMFFVVWWERVSHTHVLFFVRSTTPPILLHNFTGTCVLDGFLEFLILWVDEIDSTQFSCIVKMNLFFRPLLLCLQLCILSHWLP